MSFLIVSLFTGVSWFSAQVIHLAARFTLEISSVFICTKQRLYCQRKYVRIDEERQGRAGTAAISARSSLTKHSLSEFLLNRALSLQRSDLLGLHYICTIYWSNMNNTGETNNMSIDNKNYETNGESQKVFIWREKFAWAITDPNQNHTLAFLFFQPKLLVINLQELHEIRVKIAVGPPSR